MFNIKKNSPLSLGERVFKNAILIIFYLLPEQISKMFFEISITILLIKLRENKMDDNFIDKEKFTKILNLSYKERFVELPTYTLTWFWSDEFLNKEIVVKGDRCRISEAIKDEEILRCNLDKITNELMCHLPNLIQKKLKLDKDNHRDRFKNDIVDIFVADLSYC